METTNRDETKGTDMKASHAKCPTCGKLTALAPVYTFIVRGFCKDHGGKVR